MGRGGARGAVVSNCIRARACAGAEVEVAARARTRAVAQARDHTWSGMVDPSQSGASVLTWSKMVKSMSRTASSCAASGSALAESAWGGEGLAPW
jgi:hypothetical protein